MKLNKDIVEETWLIYRITMISKHVKWDRKIESGKYFCEKICLNEYDELKFAVDSKWLRHICDEVGCKERAIICDGNEKLFRYCCSLPAKKEKGEKGEINKIHRCINNPSRGNQNKKSDTLCQFHLTGKTHDVTIFDQIDYRPCTRNLTRNLVEKFVSNEGSKVETSLDKYSDRWNILCSKVLRHSSIKFWNVFIRKSQYGLYKSYWSIWGHHLQKTI